MIRMLEPILTEIREEAVTTKRVLDRVPADKLAWKPHPKSMSLGQLALHVATIPGSLAKLAQLEELDASQANFEPPAPAELTEIHTALNPSIRSAEECLSSMSETAALGTWRLTLRGNELFSKSRVGLLRSLMLNHWYHHRGPAVGISPAA
jgi:uncharacterized damage-inducible protein DinB